MVASQGPWPVEAHGKEIFKRCIPNLSLLCWSGALTVLTAQRPLILIAHGLTIS